MTLNRRKFISGLTALSAVAVSGLSLAAIPVIYGDGIHDDTAGIQALIDGKPVKHRNKFYCFKPGERAYLNGGKYLLKDTIYITEDSVGILNSPTENQPIFVFDHDGLGFDVYGFKLIA